MSEPESLATVEHLAERLHRHRFDRTIMLSDGIFAISATLAALEVRLPDRAPDLAAIFRESGREMTIYVISFAIMAALWISHGEYFARLKRVDGPITAITLALLCLTGLIPAVTHRMRGHPDGDAQAYYLVLGVAGLLNAALWFYGAARPGLMLDEIGPAERWRRAASSLGLPLVTLPFLVLPAEAQSYALAPLVAIFMLVRRRVLPRLFAPERFANRLASP